MRKIREKTAHEQMLTDKNEEIIYVGLHYFPHSLMSSHLFSINAEQIVALKQFQGLLFYGGTFHYLVVTPEIRVKALLLYAPEQIVLESQFVVPLEKALSHIVHNARCVVFDIIQTEMCLKIHAPHFREIIVIDVGDDKGIIQWQHP